MTAIPTCPACRQPYNGDDGCHAPPYPTAYRYGHEPHHDAAEPPPRCMDCAAPQDDHHHADCLQARCRVCEGQAATCEHDRLPTDDSP